MPALRTLVQCGPHQLGHLGLHQFLGQQLEAIAQELGIRPLLGLAEQVQ